jgi:hypothetical protein
MNARLTLLKKIAEINSDRCNDTDNYAIALRSFRVLNYLKGKVIDLPEKATKEELKHVEDLISKYADNAHYTPDGLEEPS